jgi:glycosyl transferase family 2
MSVMVTTRRRFSPWDYPLFLIVAALYCAASVVFAMSWGARSDWGGMPVAPVVLSVLLATGLLMYGLRLLTLPMMREPVHLEPPEGLKVAVVTTFVPESEPLEMLEETLDALVALEYPHETWVLDEGDDVTVRGLCERLGVRHFSRRSRPVRSPSPLFALRTKHGNYNSWLYEYGFDGYDAVLMIDPDHIPAPHFLRAVLGYLRDASVGYVQAAQVYYNRSFSFIARGAAEETYGYYSSTMMVSYAGGYPIVTGCHTLHRMSALEEVGGLAAHDADDLLITLYYQAAGWRGVYVPERLAEGLAPVDWAAYLGQQRRWARSVLDIKLRLFPKLAGQLPLRQRVIAMLHGLYYLHGFATLALVAALCASLTGVRLGVSASWQAIVFLVLASRAADFYRMRFFLRPRTEAGLHLRASILRYAKWPTLLQAALEAFRGTSFAYAVTPKKKLPVRRSATRDHLFVIAAIAVCALVGALRNAQVSWFAYLIAASLVTASAFVYGSERLLNPFPFDALAATAARERLSRRRAPAGSPEVGTAVESG